MRSYLKILTFGRIARIVVLIVLWFIIVDILLAAAPDTFIPRVLRRNSTYQSDYTEWCYHYLPRHVKHRRIFFLGDSTGQGIRMRVSDLLPVFLEKELRKHPGLEDIEMVNISQVGAGPADKMAMLAAFSDYDSDLFIIPFNHRMLSREHWSQKLLLYTVIAGYAADKHPDVPAFTELVNPTLTEQMGSRLTDTVKSTWRFYAICPLIKGWVDSDDFGDIIRKLQRKKLKQKTSWVVKRARGTFSSHRLHVALNYLNDYHPVRTEVQVPYIRALGDFMRTKNLPVYPYLIPVDLEFIEYAATTQKEHPENWIQPVYTGLALVKTLLEESGFPDIDDLTTGVVKPTGASDPDHLLREGNADLARELARLIAPILTDKENAQ